MAPNRLWRIGWAATAIVVLLAAGLGAAELEPAPAPEPAPQSQEELDRIRRDIAEGESRQAALAAKSNDIANELAELRGRMISGARLVRDQQAVLTKLEAERAALEAEIARRSVVLASERQRLAGLLGGLARLSRLPPEALIARSGAPVEMVRSALLLQAALPTVEAEARTLRRELDGLAATRRTLVARQAEIAAVRERLDQELAALAVMSRDRTALLQATEAERQQEAARLETLAAEATDLQDLIERLDAERRAREALEQAELERVRTQAAALARAAEERQRAEREAAARARLVRPVPSAIDGVMMPADGELVLRFGQEDQFGQPSPGVRLRASAGAPIIAPLDGVVRFAGEFRGYGRILILQHPGGYHSMIAGFGQIDAAVGQDVLSGEPVGLTPLPQKGQNPQSMVYFEFRQDGQPINPVQGLAQARERGRG